jgi:hypothetical protein
VIYLDVDALPDDGRPLLLIDVDGVLNAVNRSQNQRLYKIFRAGETSMSRGFTIRFRHELAAWLLELTDHFIPVWCTTWDDMANTELAEHLGLPSLPVIPTSTIDRSIGDALPAPRPHWKRPAVIEYVGKRPFAWIDDEFTRSDFDWALLRTERDRVPTLNLAIRETQGLQRHHVDKLIAWSRSVRET